MPRNTTLLLLGIVSLYQHNAVAQVSMPYWTLQSVRNPRGVVVSQIDTLAPPYRVGFRRGDVLLSINHDAANLKAKLETLWTRASLKSLGNKFTIKAMRGGKPLEIQFTNNDCFLVTNTGEKLLLEGVSEAQLHECEEYILKTSDLSRLFKDLNASDFVPAVSDGRPIGIKLYAVPSSPPGFKPGDILHHVNGHPMLTLENVFDALQFTAGVRHFEVELTRDGTEQTVTWDK